MEPEQVLAAWELGPVRVERAASGLINASFLLHGPAGVVGVLQRLNTAIFKATVHYDIEAVTAHLADNGLGTPRLVRTRAGDLWHEADGEVWRALTPVGDRTVDKLSDPADARSAGALVAAFHRATSDLAWDFVHVRGGFHDTGLRMNELADALAMHPGHRLFGDVKSLADALFAAWESWDGPTKLPDRVVHGDLKISNVRFDGPRAVALIDLDTLGRGTLDAELGDAFRSWCNPASEDATDGVFDLALFEAGVRGYAEGASGAVTPDEVRSIAPGVERICLELAARFAADALAESYFGWDPARFSTRGEHNLLRARGQLSLASAVHAERAAADVIVRSAFKAAR